MNQPNYSKYPKPSLFYPKTSKTLANHFNFKNPSEFTETLYTHKISNWICLGFQDQSEFRAINQTSKQKKKKKPQTTCAHEMTKDQLEENPDGITKRKYQIRRGKAVVVGDSTRNCCDCPNGYPKPTEARLGFVGSSKRQCIVECNRSGCSEPLEEERSHFSMEMKNQLTVRLCLRTQRLLLCYIYAFSSGSEM